MLDATTAERHRYRSTVRGREHYIDASIAEIFEEQISEQIRRFEAMLGDDRSETPPRPPRHVVTPMRRARARRSHRVVIKTAAGDSGDGDPEPEPPRDWRYLLAEVARAATVAELRSRRPEADVTDAWRAGWRPAWPDVAIGTGGIA